jgi:hypothetical protein
MPELPGGTLTVLHTDIENSTPLTVHLGDRYLPPKRALPSHNIPEEAKGETAYGHCCPM